MLDTARLSLEMTRRRPELCAWEIRAFDEIDSTNAEARRIALDGASTPVLILADSQTAGRGRMGRSFYSPRKTGLYFSILFSSGGLPDRILSMTSAASVAVLRAIRRTMGIRVGIKWVNDLYLKEKKIAGILAESMLGGEKNHFILGIGINLSTVEFPQELEASAGCLDPSARVGRELLLAEIIAELSRFLEHPEDHSWLEDYRRYSTVLGKRVVWTDAGVSREGRAEEITQDGALVVCTDDGERVTLATGEITLRRIP